MQDKQQTAEPEKKPQELDAKTQVVKRTISAKVWNDRFTTCFNNQQRQQRKWAEWYKLMYAIKTYKNIGVWRSKAFIPIMSYKIWSLIAKLLAFKPGFSVKMFNKVYSAEDLKKIERCNLKLEYDYENPELDEPIRDKLYDTMSDAVVCGTGFAKAEWVSSKRQLYSRFKKDDDTTDYRKANVTTEDYGYNNLEPLNAFDVYGAPGGRNWEDKPYHIIEYTKTMSQLVDSGFYKVDELKKYKPIDIQSKNAKLKNSRDQLIGSSSSKDQDTVDDTVDTYKIYECYEKVEGKVFLMTFIEAQLKSGHTSSDKGNWHPIRNEKRPYWHGKYPVRPYYIRRKAHSAWGESIFEITESMANAYNDVFNQLMDNLNVVGNGGLLMHSTNTTIYDFFYGPGGEVRYSGEKPEFETPSSPDIQFFEFMMSQLEKGIEWGTISSYATGAPSSASDSTQGTADGIRRLQEAAGELATFMKSNWAQTNRGVGYIFLMNNRQFLDEEVTVKMPENKNEQPIKVGHDDFDERMYVTIDEDSMQPATKEERLANHKAWLADIFVITDRSAAQAQTEAQAHMIPDPAAPPVADPNTGQPIPDPNAPMIPDPQYETASKAILLDYNKILQDTSAQYGHTDAQQYILSEDSAEEEGGEQGNSDLVSAARTSVDNGDIDPEEAQQIIDEIEGRRANPAVQPATQQA